MGCTSSYIQYIIMIEWYCTIYIVVPGLHYDIVQYVNGYISVAPVVMMKVLFVDNLFTRTRNLSCRHLDLMLCIILSHYCGGIEHLIETSAKEVL